LIALNRRFVSQPPTNVIYFVAVSARLITPEKRAINRLAAKLLATLLARHLLQTALCLFACRITEDIRTKAFLAAGR
jgi:hypothetical protein